MQEMQEVEKVGFKPKENAETEKENPLKMLQKTMDMMEYAYPCLMQYPKAVKFTLAARIMDCMNNILGLLITAQKRYFKKTTLQDLDIEIAKLKAFIRLSHNLRYLPMRKYEHWSGMVVEIGRMLGGWMKGIQEKTGQHRE